MNSVFTELKNKFHGDEMVCSLVDFISANTENFSSSYFVRLIFAYFKKPIM